MLLHQQRCCHMFRVEKGIRSVVQSIVDSRGRFTLPQAVRLRLGLEPGSRLAFTLKGNGRFIVSVVLADKQTQRKGARGNGMARPAIDTTSELIGRGHLIPVAEFQRRMGWSTRSAVWKALASKRIFAMEFGCERYFPSFFCDRAYDRRYLEAVTKQLGNLPGGAKFQFFVARKGSFGGKTVLEAIAAGQLEKVLRLAVAHAEA